MSESPDSPLGYQLKSAVSFWCYNVSQMLWYCSVRGHSGIGGRLGAPRGLSLSPTYPPCSRLPARVRAPLGCWFSVPTPLCLLGSKPLMPELAAIGKNWKRRLAVDVGSIANTCFKKYNYPPGSRKIYKKYCFCVQIPFHPVDLHCV